MRRKRPQKPAPLRPLHGNPLDAVPRIASGVEARPDGDAGLHLRRKINPEGRVQHFFHRYLRWRREQYINLDKRGSDFWGLLDGTRDLRSIATLLARQWETSEAECQRAVLVYTRALMIRRLVEIQLAAPAGEPRT